MRAVIQDLEDSLKRGWEYMNSHAVGYPEQGPAVLRGITRPRALAMAPNDQKPSARHHTNIPWHQGTIQVHHSTTTPHTVDMLR